MNFYYDPILGLRYNFFEHSITIINVGTLPAISLDEVLKTVREMGIMIVDSNSQQPYIEEFHQITDYITI
jgi:hypothetical protein